MSTASDSKKIYFENLDVVRFLAAFMIIILHAYEAYVEWYGAGELLLSEAEFGFSFIGKLADQFIRNLGIGVDIFFLISGFLITYILIVEKERFGKIHIGKFMMRRSLRIWPLYFFLIGSIAFLSQWVGSNANPNYLMHALFLGNFDIISTETWSYPFPHFWSICVEEHFYLVWPFIIMLTPKKKLLPVFALVILSSILFRIHTAYTMDYPWFTLFLHTMSRIDILVIGAIGAYFYSENPFEFRLSRFLRGVLYSALIVSLCLEPVVLWDTVFLAGFKKFFYMGIIAVLLLDYNFNPNYKHFLPAKSIIHYFGKISYGIYMYGNILLLVVIKKVMAQIDSTNVFLFFLITISLSIIVPIISYELFEKQFLRLTKRFRVVKTDR